METKDAAAPEAIAAVVERSGPRRRSRAPLRPVAPTMTGSATVRDSRFACGAAEAPPARGGERRAVAGDARNEGRRLADSERKPVGGAQVVLGPLLWRPVGERASRPIRRAAPRRSCAGRRGAARSGVRARSRRSPAGGVTARSRPRGERRDVGARSRPRGAGRSGARPRLPREARPRSSCWSRGPGRPVRQPANHGSSERCAELETGSSSAGPWTPPRISARRHVRASRDLARSRPAIKRRGSTPARRPPCAA